MLFLFWLSVLMILYVYIGYPVIIMVVALIRRQEVRKGNWVPEISILIAAFNESENIQKTIQNKLKLNYPAEKLEIIVISDGSTDGTDEIVRSFENDNVKLIRQEPRAGKTSALNMAATIAKGEIIVFSDANSIYETNALKQLVINFADPEVGYVTGKMIYVDEDGSTVGQGCSAYMKYENMLRKYETLVGTVIGVDGGIDAVRKELYQKMENDQLPDFVLPLKVIEKGYRVVYEPNALLKEDALKKPSDEYKMRVRVSLRALWALYDMRNLLAFKSGKILTTWQLWSHKVIRYSCFIFIILAFFSNIYLLSEGFIYILAFFVQLLVYIGFILAERTDRNDSIGKLLKFCHYFILINVACGHAFIKFLMGKKQIMWNPRKG